MLRPNAKVGALVDGTLTLFEDAPARRVRGVDFGTPEGLKRLHEMPFRSTMLRQRDLDLLGETVSQSVRKVVVRRLPSMGTALSCTIGDVLYEVTRVDSDRLWHYLYLTEVTTDGTCELVRVTSARDDRGETRSREVPVTVHVRESGMGAAIGESAGKGSMWPTLSLTVRSCDYDRETVLCRDGRRYRVTKVTGDGEWLRLTCEGGLEGGKGP